MRHDYGKRINQSHHASHGYIIQLSGYLRQTLQIDHRGDILIIDIRDSRYLKNNRQNILPQFKCNDSEVSDP